MYNEIVQCSDYTYHGYSNRYGKYCNEVSFGYKVSIEGFAYNFDWFAPYVYLEYYHNNEEIISIKFNFDNKTKNIGQIEKYIYYV